MENREQVRRIGGGGGGGGGAERESKMLWVNLNNKVQDFTCVVSVYKSQDQSRKN